MNNEESIRKILKHLEIKIKEYNEIHSDIMGAIVLLKRLGNYSKYSKNYDLKQFKNKLFSDD